MTRREDSQFQSGLIELLVHAFLRKLNQKVTVHPEIEGSAKHPDFAVLDSDDQ